MTRRNVGLALLGLGLLVLLAAGLTKQAGEDKPMSSSDAAELLMGAEPEEASSAPYLLAIVGGVCMLGGIATVISSLPQPAVVVDEGSTDA